MLFGPSTKISWEIMFYTMNNKDPWFYCKAKQSLFLCPRIGTIMWCQCGIESMLTVRYTESEMCSLPSVCSSFALCSLFRWLQLELTRKQWQWVTATLKMCFFFQPEWKCNLLIILTTAGLYKKISALGSKHESSLVLGSLAMNLQHLHSNLYSAWLRAKLFIPGHSEFWSPSTQARVLTLKVETLCPCAEINTSKWNVLVYIKVFQSVLDARLFLKLRHSKCTNKR